MANENVKPTRMELLIIKGKLKLAEKGHGRPFLPKKGAAYRQRTVRACELYLRQDE